ncbi:MAG: NTP transferase domain-containing protein [Rhodospirillales bacterium]|nr:NTP transferase domain-containing protein [Rhodospirillales bacterium]
MQNSKVAAVILGAGKGTRMKSDLPKVMMPLCGKPMIRHIVDAMEEMKVDKIITVTAPDGDLVRKEVAPHPTCVQAQQLGTGNAVLSAKDELKGFDGDVLVIFGDNPITTVGTYHKMIAKRDEGYAIVVLGFTPADAARYGRLKIENGELVKIVEFKDATDEEKAIKLCNSGIMCFDGKVMLDILSEIGNDNAAKEYYLTDAIAIARSKGMKCAVVECSAEEVAGANTREELALLESFLQKRQGKK